MTREAYPNTVTFASFGPPTQNRDLCVGSACPLLSEFIQNSTAETEVRCTSRRVRASGEVLLKLNVMAKHKLKWSPSVHSAVKWLTLLAAAKHSSWLWFAGSDRTYRWLTPSQSPEPWTPFWMASWWEKQGKRNTKNSFRHTPPSVVICKFTNSIPDFLCHSFRLREKDERFSTNTTVAGLQMKFHLWKVSVSVHFLSHLRTNLLNLFLYKAFLE